MKGLLLLLAGAILYTGCNNLSSGEFPDSPLPVDISGSSSNGFWISEGQQLSFDSGKLVIHCLGISAEANNGYMVQLYISYPGSSAPDEWIYLYTISPNNSHILAASGNPELTLLGAEKSEKGARARLKIRWKLLW